MDAVWELDLGRTWARYACRLSGLSCPKAKSLPARCVCRLVNTRDYSELQYKHSYLIDKKQGPPGTGGRLCLSQMRLRLRTGVAQDHSDDQFITTNTGF